MGFFMGVIFAALAVYVLMPKMMIVTQESRYNYQNTVQKLEEALASLSWGHKGTIHMTEEIKAKTQKDLGGKIGIIQLCHADYAFQVLAQDKTRFVSCLMPCSISVWESHDGKTYVSKMNTGLMGKLFGGVISSVMGGHVAKDEKIILQDIVKH